MVYMKYFCDGLTPELMKRAEDELGETDEVKMKCLAEIKNLINDEEDFHPCMDDIFLLRFLRVKKFKTDKAFQSLKDYYVYKAQYSGIISDRLPSDIRHVFEHGESTILEHRYKDGAGVFVARVGYYDTKRFTSDGQITLMLIATEVGLRVEATQITGYSVIVDFDNFSIEKARHFGTPRAIYRIIITILRSMPCRIKSYHIVNEARFVSGMLSVGMHLVSKKLRKRIHFHGRDLESLHKFLSPEILPEEYGGQQGPLKKYATAFGERALSLEEHFKEMNKYGYKGKTLEKLRK
ncbi:alpha-tocopherol transfer protein-like [Parasteatoda tepidariorum]|uniref:alpha-tocopherol transfer protein-like n=1 Tax=Parasteatoda tepidariorum TaxID=114398 RepID=UPI001C72478D|nr:alpha-tocopherol transfer protein-like [Parasteatoda tepidariorum]